MDGDLSVGKDVHWVRILSRQITPQLLSVATAPKGAFPDLIGAGFDSQLFVPRGAKHEFYLSGPEYGVFAGEITRRLNEDPSFADLHASECRSMCERIKEYSETARRENLDAWSQAKLAAWYTEYLGLFDEFYLYLWTPHVIEEYLEGRLREELAAFLEERGEPDSFDEHFDVVTTKLCRNLAEQEEEELLKLAAEQGSSDPKAVEERVAEHARKWAWLPFYSYDMDPWSEAYFSDRVKKIQDVETLLADRREDYEAKKKRFHEVRARLEARESLASLVNVVQEYLFLRTDRTDTLRILLFNMVPYFERVGQLASLSYDEVIHMTPAETLEFLESGTYVAVDEIERRMARFLIVSLKNLDVTLVSDPVEIDTLITDYLGPRDSDVVTEVPKLSGTGVFRGVVEGSVRLIEARADWDKMQEGDVLVTSMTTPEMLPIYTKAVAIVTDEGGLTCHAAIISRELQIPCVIGTGNATDVLRDGMRVRVDSAAGIVESIAS